MSEISLNAASMIHRHIVSISPSLILFHNLPLLKSNNIRKIYKRASFTFVYAKTFFFVFFFSLLFFENSVLRTVQYHDLGHGGPSALCAGSSSLFTYSTIRITCKIPCIHDRKYHSFYELSVDVDILALVKEFVRAFLMNVTKMSV